MTIQQLHVKNDNDNDNNSRSILLKINNNSITMVMRRMYRRLFGTPDVRRRVSMVMVLTGLCVFTLVFRVMLPQTILTAGVKSKFVCLCVGGWGMGDRLGGWVVQSCYKSKYTTIVLVKAVVCLRSNGEQISQDTDPNFIDALV